MCRHAPVEERIDLDQRLRDLVKLRPSQLNGRTFWIDMHWTHARAAGEPEQRESPLYEEASARL